MNKPIALLFSGVFLLLLAACNEGTTIQSLDDPAEYTTEDIQNLQKDTIVVALDRDVLYVFDENNLVRYKIVNMYKSGDQMILVPFYVFLFFTLLITFFIVFVINKAR